MLSVSREYTSQSIPHAIYGLNQAYKLHQSPQPAPACVVRIGWYQSGWSTCKKLGGNITRCIDVRIQSVMKLAVTCLLRPSMINNRRSEVPSGRVAGSKMVIIHSYICEAEVQPLLLVEKRQSEGVCAGIQTIFVYFALKMIKGGIASLAALMHSIEAIHSCWSDMTF